jgi:site-specific recombinase XerD
LKHFRYLWVLQHLWIRKQKLDHGLEPIGIRHGPEQRVFGIALVRHAGLSAMPTTAAALCGFLADEAAAGKRASTLGRRLAAIRYFHRAAGYDTPTGDEKVKAVLSGIRRTIGAAPLRKKAATADITIAMAATGTSLRELRDRAVLLLGFAGAFRRSELVALDVADIEDVPIS